jgi:GntP family gluconate:H+ symporter
LLVPFVLAAALKTAQGSSLVTMFTAPAIILPFLPSLGLSPEIAALATCAGALAVVHANDSFFWLVTGFGEMDVSAGYRNLTVITLLQALVALLAVWVLSLVL